MDFKCAVCGKLVHITPSAVRVKTGYGCRSCSRKMSLDELKEKVRKIHPNISIIGNYVSSKTKILCRCDIDGYEWEERPNDLLNGIGCHMCNNHMIYTAQSFKEKFNEVNVREIELLTDFVNHNTPILCKCKIDGYEWYAYPYDLLNNRSGCRMCANNAPYTTKSFKEKMYTINPDIEIIGEYINSKTKILCRCLKCGYEWYAIPNNLITNRTGCPAHFEKSKGERRIAEYLTENNISYTLYKTYDGLVGIGGKPLSYDFYLEDYNLLIEYHGKQHECAIDYYGGEESFKVQLEHDRRKLNYAKEHGI